MLRAVTVEITEALLTYCILNAGKHLANFICRYTVQPVRSDPKRQKRVSFGEADWLSVVIIVFRKRVRSRLYAWDC